MTVAVLDAFTGGWPPASPLWRPWAAAAVHERPALLDAPRPPRKSSEGPRRREEPDHHVTHQVQVDPARRGPWTAGESETLGGDRQELDGPDPERDDDRQSRDGEVVEELSHGARERPPVRERGSAAVAPGDGHWQSSRLRRYGAAQLLVVALRSAPAEGRSKHLLAVAGVGGGDGHSRRDDLVGAGQRRGVERDVGGGQLAGGLAPPARAAG